MPFAASVAATAIATASYCVTSYDGAAHVNRAHAATDTYDEVRKRATRSLFFFVFF
jgi:hypothetical protein